jgi:WD40 repeat protein
MTNSPDGRTLATSSVDRTVRLWDIETQQAIGTPLPGRAVREH